jgi:hypothetical protein
MKTWLNGRTSPEMLYLETKWSSLIPFAKTSDLLQEVLPVEDSVNPETVRNHLQDVCRSLFDPSSGDIFLIAANDGQLIESWRRLRDTESVKRARQVIEELLVEGRQEHPGARLKFFNLSRTNSADLLDRALDAFLGIGFTAIIRGC